MPRTVIVEPGQCMEDIALQEYGSIDGVRELLFDNPEVFVDGFSTDLEAGTELVVRDAPLDKPVYDAAKRMRVVPATAAISEDTIGPDGDYNDDFNNDHFINPT